MSREGKPWALSQGSWVAVRPKHVDVSTVHSAQHGCQVPRPPAHHQDRLNVTHSPFSSHVLQSTASSLWQSKCPCYSGTYHSGNGIDI